MKNLPPALIYPALEAMICVVNGCRYRGGGGPCGAGCGSRGGPASCAVSVKSAACDAWLAGPGHQTGRVARATTADSAPWSAHAQRHLRPKPGAAPRGAHWERAAFGGWSCDRLALEQESNPRPTNENSSLYPVELSKWWRCRESNPGPNKQQNCFLHA